jgi:nitrogen-specific signal transduction histidine kinase
MTPPQKESLRYGLLLVILLAVAAVAVGVSIGFLDSVIPDADERLIVAGIFWSITMGFMLIAGAFGLRAVNFAAKTEALRQISLLVDHMHDVHDGVLALDRRGTVIGMNPAAEAFFGNVRKAGITQACPAIPDAELELLLNTEEIAEKEWLVEQNGKPSRLLRFRIQPPSAGISLVLISDITSVAKARAHQRRIASLQLAGHMAQGIANDFNDLLCGISGHATLLVKQAVSDIDRLASANAIQDCAERGIRLARQLVQLSMPQLGVASSITTQVSQHVKNGIEILEASLEYKWKIHQMLHENIPPVNIPASLIENIVHSVGLIIAEANPAGKHQLQVLLHSVNAADQKWPEGRIAGLLEIAMDPDLQSDTPVPTACSPDEGVISSLVQALVTQAGGRFDAVAVGRRTHRVRIWLPEVEPEDWLDSQTGEPLAIGLEAYITGWRVLLCLAPETNPAVHPYLEKLQIHLDTVRDENAFLTALTSEEAYQAILIEPAILGQNFESIIQIINRMCSSVGLVVVTDMPSAMSSMKVVSLHPHSPPQQWIHAMIDARSRWQPQEQEPASLRT